MGKEKLNFFFLHKAHLSSSVFSFLQQVIKCHHLNIFHILFLLNLNCSSLCHKKCFSSLFTLLHLVSTSIIHKSFLLFSLFLLPSSSVYNNTHIHIDIFIDRVSERKEKKQRDKGSVWHEMKCIKILSNKCDMLTFSTFIPPFSPPFPLRHLLLLAITVIIIIFSLFCRPSLMFSIIFLSHNSSLLSLSLSLSPSCVVVSPHHWLVMFLTFL